MAKKHSALSAQGARAKKNVKVIPDHKIDFSDIPELSDQQLKSVKRLGRPLLGVGPRKLISVRIDPLVLDQLKSKAKQEKKPYQTLINEVLAKYARKKARTLDFHRLRQVLEQPL